MTNLTIPSVGESVTEVTILHWTRNDGDYVSKDDPIAELETDKANVDLRASVSGKLHPTKQPGQVAKVGEVVAQIDEAAAKPATAAAAGGNRAPAAPVRQPPPKPEADTQPAGQSSV